MKSPWKRKIPQTGSLTAQMILDVKAQIDYNFSKLGIDPPIVSMEIRYMYKDGCLVKDKDDCPVKEVRIFTEQNKTET